MLHPRWLDARLRHRKNWFAKAEYDYLSFGRHTALATDGTTFLTDRSSISQVKVGVNYRFGPGVVVAKY